MEYIKVENLSSKLDLQVDLEEELAYNTGLIKGMQETAESLRLMSGVAFRDGNEVKAALLRVHSKKIIELVNSKHLPASKVLRERIDKLIRTSDKEFEEYSGPYYN